MKYRLIMKRGKREVVIGDFPSLYRAEAVYGSMTWSASWKPLIIRL